MITLLFIAEQADNADRAEEGCTGQPGPPGPARPAHQAALLPHLRQLRYRNHPTPKVNIIFGSPKIATAGKSCKCKSRRRPLLFQQIFCGEETRSIFTKINERLQIKTYCAALSICIFCSAFCPRLVLFKVERPAQGNTELTKSRFKVLFELVIKYKYTKTTLAAGMVCTI